MAVTEAQLNRATLARQLLLGRERAGAAEAVGRVVALQAQEPPSPYVALWNRTLGFDGSELDEAFAERSVVKATTIRITLHAVTAEDYPAFHAAMVPYLRAARLHDRRYTDVGLSVDDADTLLPRLLDLLAEPRSKAEIEPFCGPPRMWWALRTFAPLWHVPTGGPWSFGREGLYEASGTSPGGDVDAGRATLAYRYLEGFGPATAADIGTFTMLRKPIVQQALRDLEGRIVELAGPGGAVLYDVADGAVPPARTKAPPRLLGMWDNVLLAYADRSRIIPDDYRPLVIRRNGDVLPTLLVDGRVAGVWRVVEGAVEVSAFHDLPAATWKAVGKEAEALAGFLTARDPSPYKRYAHWWDGLLAAEVRHFG